MKTLILFLGLIFVNQLHGQPGCELFDDISGTWKANSSLFEDKGTQEYQFTKSEKMNEPGFFDWGYSIHFNPNGTFYTSYSAPCGNDCFTTVHGTYKWEDLSTLSIYVKNIERNGFCSKKDEKVEKEIGVYKTELKDGVLRLILKE